MKKCHIVTGLGYGDEGKGATVSDLARLARDEGALGVVVVRHNGGSQCGHNVHYDDRSHEFSQFGSASFHNDAHTHFSEFALLNPMSLIMEERAIVKESKSNPVIPLFRRFSANPKTRIITPFHIEANRAREEARGDGAHGTCCHGVGETVMDWMSEPDMTLYAEDLRSARTVIKKLEYWRDRKAADIKGLGLEPGEAFSDKGLIQTYALTAAHLTELINISALSALVDGRYQDVVFEGAQGVLLDEGYGFHPHTTWTNTTTENARWLFRTTVPDDGAYNAFPNDGGGLESIGVIRTYMTRHGQGPFVTEDANVDHHEPDNVDSGAQGKFRQGHLDMVALRYAIAVSGGIDTLSVTHLDRLGSVNKVCTAYEVDGEIMYDLPVGEKGNHAHQEFLTDICYKATPIYDEWKKNKFLENLESALSVPVGYMRNSRYTSF